MKKVRFQMFIDREQKEILKKMEHDYNISVAELIRRAVDKFISDWKNKNEIPASDYIKNKLLSISGVCKGGPRDLADKHDYYLYRLRK